MVHIQIFPKKIDQNASNGVPSHVRSIIRRIAHDVMHKARNVGLERQRQYAHALLHMKLYQRYGRQSSSSFAEAAYAELDQLILSQSDERPDDKQRVSAPSTT